MAQDGEYKTTNVDEFLMWHTDDGEIALSFTDVFGDGEIYTFPLEDATRIRDGLTEIIDYFHLMFQPPQNKE